MAETLNVDTNTYRALEFAARMSNSTPGEVVARLVERASAPNASESRQPEEVEVFADYAGHRTEGTYDRVTARVDITSGPLAGRTFKSPTGAARAVVAHFNPGVSPNRNGWSFWTLADGSGRFLQAIRRRS